MATVDLTVFVLSAAVTAAMSSRSDRGRFERGSHAGHSGHRRHGDGSGHDGSFELRWCQTN
ncbi:MAG TPA: hypothetical protein VGP18_02535, partial [Solirubrobacteraceae bacterium]|nr:hypothetical protein [Solirubrobacteraceae bacterium]